MADDACLLPFLEKRDYLHGTTLFRFLRPQAPANVETCFRIIRTIRSNAVRVVDAKAATNAVARLDWTVDGTTHALAVEELPPRPPVERQSYDEARVATATRVADRVARLDAATPFDAVATAVPLFKAVLKANDLTPTEGGQWMFTRLDSRMAPPAAASPMELRLELARPRLVAKASISVAATVWADMYFSWVS